MRKILSIVIAVLMVSMMIPSMAFADAAISAEAVTGLVAGESFKYEVAATDGTEVKLEVNAQLFDIVDGDDGNAIESKILTASNGKAVFSVVVKNAVPASYDAAVRVTVGDAVFMTTFSIANRKVGDANGDTEITIDDSSIVKRYLAGLSVVNFSVCAADATQDGAVTIDDSSDIKRFLAGLSVTSEKFKTSDYLGSGLSVDEVKDPFAGSDTPVEPDEPAKVVSPASGVYAYYQNGTVYYTFTAGENAESYAISVNGVAVELADPTATSGSFACANWIEDADNTISVVAKAEGAEDAAAATTTIIVADANGALAQWLNANGLNDVTITVYEIQ